MIRLKVGDVAQIKYFNVRPKHWNSKGKMDKYMGKEVRIQSIDSFRYYIDGNHRWYWRLSDFYEVQKDFLEDEDMLL